MVTALRRTTSSNFKGLRYNYLIYLQEIEEINLSHVLQQLVNFFRGVWDIIISVILMAMIVHGKPIQPLATRKEQCPLSSDKMCQKHGQVVLQAFISRILSSQAGVLYSPLAIVVLVLTCFHMVYIILQILLQMCQWYAIQRIK